MINYVVESVLIEKQHLISVFSTDEANPENVIISSLAAPVRIHFGYRGCTWYSQEKKFVNGNYSEHAIDFGLINSKSQVKKWVLENKEKEFVAFVRLRNGHTYIVGSKKSGLELTYSWTILKDNSLIVILGGNTENVPVFSTYGIHDFFVGRDFSDDFNIDFG